MANYIEREKVMDALLHEKYGYLCEDAIKKIPNADVMPVNKLTEAGRLLLFYNPEIINSLADRLHHALVDYALNGQASEEGET